MKTIGILGGMGWESSAIYYRILNQEVRRRLGGFHSARIVLESVDFAEFTILQERGEWDAVGELVLESGRRLEGAGADFWLIACNTVHRVVEAVEDAVGIPLLHIADASGRALEQAGVKRVGLLGTVHTMRGDFYSRRLERGFDVATLVPDEETQSQIHTLILDELVHGISSPSGRGLLDEASRALGAKGAQAILLACTELGLLYDEHEASGRAGDGLAIYDTATLHAVAAVDRALAD